MNNNNILEIAKDLKKIEDNSVIIGGQLLLKKIEPNIAITQVNSVKKELQKINNNVNLNKDSITEKNFEYLNKYINKDNEYLDKVVLFASELLASKQK